MSRGGKGGFSQFLKGGGSRHRYSQGKCRSKTIILGGGKYPSYRGGTHPRKTPSKSEEGQRKGLLRGSANEEKRLTQKRVLAPLQQERVEKEEDGHHGCAKGISVRKHRGGREKG